MGEGEADTGSWIEKKQVLIIQKLEQHKKKQETTRKQSAALEQMNERLVLGAARVYDRCPTSPNRPRVYIRLYEHPLASWYLYIYKIHHELSCYFVSKNIAM